MKRYRIGEFAQKLGVTPDFLKYCEKKEIITPQVESNGYRYYGFEQASRVLEYIKCKNQGMTAEEIRVVLQGSSYEGLLEIMRHKAEALKGQMAFEAELLRYYEAMDELREQFVRSPAWQVRRCEGFYFLPHSVEAEFIGDQRIEEKVRAWNAYFPIVESAYRLVRDEENGWLKRFRGENVWGFAIGEGAARRLGVPVDGPVVHVPAQRYLEVFSVSDMDKRDYEHAFARELMTRCGFELYGDAYSRIVLKIWENGVRREYSVLYLPIA